MVICEVSILRSGSGHCSVMGNGTKDLTRTRLWKITKNPRLLKAGVGPDSWAPRSLVHQ